MARSSSAAALSASGRPTRMVRASAGLCSLLLAAWLAPAAADPSVPVAYCASVNTGSTSANSSIYQSDGLCFDLCSADYAYAVIQGQNCWCSDYTPSKSVQVDTSECNEPCSGYPSDYCGGDGLYGYMALNKAPSGTAGAAATTSTSSSSSSSTTSKTSSTTTSTLTTSTKPATTSALTTMSTSSRSSSTSSSSQTSTTTTPTVQTVTAGGVVQTVTVTPTPTASSADTAAASTSAHKGVSTGAAVGIAVGVVVAAVAALALAFVVWRRRRQQRRGGSGGAGGAGGGSADDALFAAASHHHHPKTPSPRGTSPNASSSPQVSEVAPAAAAFARRPGDGAWENDQSGRRRSTLMPIDPRIDPAFSGIYSRTDNKSRDSVNSLRDDHDYSRRVHQPTRVLRATNPDPDD